MFPPFPLLAADIIRLLVVIFPADCNRTLPPVPLFVEKLSKTPLTAITPLVPVELIEILPPLPLLVDEKISPTVMFPNAVKATTPPFPVVIPELREPADVLIAPDVLAIAIALPVVVMFPVVMF